jgi:phosphonate transport system substrate-binding protein
MDANTRSINWAAYSLLFILVLSVAGTGQTAAADNSARETTRPYVLGVFPHLPPRELEKVFAPMAADLGEVVDRKILFRSSTTYEKFSEQLDQQKFDIAFIQPFDYVRMADKYGYLPLATRTQRLSAILVVKPDSALSDIKSLKGKRIALPPETAAVSHLVKNHLRINGLDPDKDVKINYYRSHVSCMQQVLIGEADVCGTAAPAVRFFEKRMKVSLKTIMKTMDIPHTLFAISPRLPETDREKIKARIVDWANTEKGQKLLNRGSLKPFVVISDSEYDIVRKMERK